MAALVFPDGSSPLFNPAAYGEASAEARKNKAAKEAGAKGGIKKKSFAAFFEKIALGELKELPASGEAVHELLEAVHHTGDLLSRRPFPPEIKAYKEAVRNFIHHVVEYGFDTEEQDGGSRLKPKKYTLIQVVDKKLEEMASAILRGQTDKLEILAKIDEIKGLLVDLVQ